MHHSKKGTQKEDAENTMMLYNFVAAVVDEKVHLGAKQY